MKKLLLYAVVACTAFPALAELNGNGYYRVQNAFTKRYAYLLDDKGSLDKVTTTADVAALELYKDAERMISDPATVFLIDAAPQGNSMYDISGQGTSIHGLFNEYVMITPTRKPYEDKQAYYISATISALQKYLGDMWNDLSRDKGYASIDATGDDRYWYIDPISASSDMYFGVKPTVKADGKQFAPFFAGFPFSAYSEGVKVYAVYDIDPRGGAIYSEIEGTVPEGTPVIVACPGANPSDNRLNIGGEGKAVADNKLKGVYFENYSEYKHTNLTDFNQETMRVLGTDKEGRLAFVRANLKYIPRNQAYLQLTDPATYAVDDFLLLTEDEREEALNAVAVIPVTAMVDVYRLDGTLVKSGIAKEDVKSIGKGIYILRSAGVSEKHIVR